MKRGLVKSSRYSPGNMDGDSLETLFVGRHVLLEDIVGKIRLSATTDQKHFILLVGPRGSGKTHFVSLVYHRLMAEPEKVPGLAMAVLNEDEWGVASYLDFLVRILQSLAAQLSNPITNNIKDIYKAFSANPEKAQALAEDMLSESIGGKTLLLICENLVDLFEGLGEEGQKRWRSFIQQSEFWTILATTPAIFSEIRLQECPFYGFFNIRPLRRIGFETALELLIRKSLHESKLDLANFLRTPIGRARVRAIHHLAGGNHRVYVVLFDFLDKESLNDLVGPFMRMVDDMTPYYQDRIRQLSPTKRKIVEFLCQHAQPTAIKDIATPCLMSHQTATKQIGELVAEGFVSKSKSGRKTLCELTEPLMRICIEVKDNRTEHLGLFVEFLRHWYSSRELQRRLTILPHKSGHHDVDRTHVAEAMRCYESDHDEPFIKALRQESARCVSKCDFDGLAAVQAKLVEDTGKSHHFSDPIATLRKSGDLEDAKNAGKAIASIAHDDSGVHFEMARLYLDLDQLKLALSEIDRALDLEPDSCPYMCVRGTLLIQLERFDDAIENEHRLLALDENHFHSYSQLIESLCALERPDEAIEYAEKLIAAEPDDSDSLADAAHPFFSLEKYDRALELTNRAVTLDSENYYAVRSRAMVLFTMENYEAASNDLNTLIRMQPDSVSAHCRLSDSLLYSGEFDEAIKIARKLLALDPDHGHAVYVICTALIELGQVNDGLRELSKMITIDDPDSLAHGAEIFIEHDRIEEANRFLEHALEIEPTSVQAWLAMSLAQTELAEYEAGKLSADEAKNHGATAIQFWVRSSQALAGQIPLTEAMIGVLGELANNAECEANDFSREIAKSIKVSLKEFGPAHINSGISLIRKLLPENSTDGLVAAVLTKLLDMNLDGIGGSAKEWTAALAKLEASLSDLDACKIPVQMVTASILFLKTGDRTHLLKLPKEQRTLLDEEVFDSEAEAQTLH